MILQVGTISFLEHGILGELLKVKELVNHYVNDHQESENVFDFVYNHYWGQASNEMDHAEFPFQNTHINNYNFCIPNLTLSLPILTSENNCPSWHQSQLVLLDMYESKGIWQPPGA
jgi:hypothetical protein